MNNIVASVPTAMGEVSFQIPADYPIPDRGNDFYFNFESAITDLDEWEAVRSMLENNTLTVEAVASDRIVLREGPDPSLRAEQSEAYLSDLQLYWEVNPWTSPPAC